MGEYPALSDQEIASINLQRLRLESTLHLDNVTVTVEHYGTGI
jgi:hypothetical protein